MVIVDSNLVGFWQIRLNVFDVGRAKPETILIIHKWYFSRRELFIFTMCGHQPKMHNISIDMNVKCSSADAYFHISMDFRNADQLTIWPQNGREHARIQYTWANWEFLFSIFFFVFNLVFPFFFQRSIYMSGEIENSNEKILPFVIDSAVKFSIASKTWVHQEFWAWTTLQTSFMIICINDSHDVLIVNRLKTQAA